MQGMDFRGVVFLGVVVIALIIGIVSWRKSHEIYDMEIKVKKPIAPTLIIESKGSKVDTTYVYQFRY